MRTIMRIGLLILAAALVAVLLWRTAKPGEQAAVGTPAPPTHGTDADGATSSLADYHGKVVMLDFWGNW